MQFNKKKLKKATCFNQLYRPNISQAPSESEKKKVYDLTFEFDRIDEELSFLIGDLVSS